MSNSPEEIRRDIDATRRELSQNVDALTDKVSPARIVERRMDSAKSAVFGAKDKVMGAASSGTDTASSAPTMARQKTQGNPLAAGVIAFGVGWLVSSLLPATAKEEKAATAVKDKASEHSDAIKQPFSEAATEMKDNLAGPAQEAVTAVKETASDAGSNVQEEVSLARDEVAQSTR